MEGKLSPEACRLCEQHMPLAQALARSLHVRGMEEYDDVHGDALLGLVGAASRFDTEGSAVFSTWAWFRIVGAIRDGRRKRFGRRYLAPEMVSIDRLLTTSDVAMVSTLRSNDPPVGAALEHRDMLARIPSRERLVLRLTIEFGITLHEVGERLGVSESYVCQLRMRALERLREQQAA